MANNYHTTPCNYPEDYRFRPYATGSWQRREKNTC